MWLPVVEVSFLAKEKFCTYSKYNYNRILDKARLHQSFTEDEIQKYEFLTQKILNTVNQKARLVGSLSKGGRAPAKFFYKGLLYFVVFKEGKGKVVNIELDSAMY